MTADYIKLLLRRSFPFFLVFFFGFISAVMLGRSVKADLQLLFENDFPEHTSSSGRFATTTQLALYSNVKNFTKPVYCFPTDNLEASSTWSSESF